MPGRHIRGIDPALEVAALCRKQGVMLDQRQTKSLSDYVQRLNEWNSRINLVSRRDEENIWFSHVLHSLTPLFFLEIPSGLSLLDLGSGGGLPGVPLAIACPGLRVTLLDSIRKKTAALVEILAGMGLDNVRVMTGRAEDLARTKGFTDRFDIVVARAVAPLPDLIRWSRPLVFKEGGKRIALRGSIPPGDRFIRLPCLLALKGGDLKREIREAYVKLGEKDLRVLDLVFDGSEALGLVDKKMVFVEY